MKAATGELQLTVITMIAIAAVIGFFWFLWPQIQNSITSQWGNISSNYQEGGTSTPAQTPMIIFENR